MKRILITGATGMLGEAIVEELRNEFMIFGVARTPSPVLASSKQVICDLMTAGSTDVIRRSVVPDVIIHTAAYVDLEFCENNPDMAYRLHVEVPRNLAMAFPNAYFMYVSTDSVFDGRIGGYHEGSTPAPVNQYARTKWEGENVVRQLLPRCIILRGNFYGKKTHGNASLADWAISTLLSNERVNGFDDVFFNPLYTRQYSEAVRNLLELPVEYTGVLNLGAAKSVSKYEFIHLLACEFGLNRSLIDRSSMADVLSPVTRPHNTTLNTSRAQGILGKEFSLIDGIRRFHDNYLSRI